MRRREADHEVGPFAVELLEDLARGLADRLERERVQRQAQPRTRLDGAWMAVRGTTTVEPDSVIVQRASIVPGAGNSSSPFTSRYPNLPGSTKNCCALRPISSPSRANTVSSVPLPSVVGRRAHEHDEVRRELGRELGHGSRRTRR